MARPTRNSKISGPRFTNDAGEQVTVGVDWDNNGQVYVERGQTNGFSNRYFTNDFSMQESNDDNTITLHVLVDRSVLEVFVDDGIQVCPSSFSLWPVGLRRKGNGRRLIALSWSRTCKPIR